MKSYKDASQAYTKRSTRGMLVTTSEYRGSIWKLKWDKNVKLETHFRPVGPLTEDGKDFLPWRFGPEENNFGPWIVRVPIFQGGTARTLTFIPAYGDPDSPGDALDTDIHPTPVTEFIDGAKKAAWNDSTGRLKHILLEGAQNRGPALPKKLKAFGLVQAVLLKHGTYDYYTRPQLPTLMMLSESACIALEESLNKEVEGYNGSPDDFNKRFVCGDILGADSGRILSFYNANAGTETSNENVDWGNAGKGNGQQQRSQQTLARYACELRQPLPLPRLPDGRLRFAVESQVFTPWEKTIRFLSEKEMVDMIVRAYEDLPALLLQCLRPYAAYLPDFVKGNATVQVMGGPEAAAAGPQSPDEPAQTVPPPAAQGAQPAADGAAVVDWDNTNTPAPEGSEPADNGFARDIRPDDLHAAGGGAPAQAPAAAQPAAAATNNDADVQGAMEKLSQLRGGTPAAQ